MALGQMVGGGPGEEAIQGFAASLRGRLVRPADPEYDAARQVWNGMIDRYPALIARCAGTADVIAAVNFAREHDLLVAVRGGGHNVAGNAVCDGGLVINLSAMRGVHVDPRARMVRAQGGATWADADRETQVFGLAAPGGVVSMTGIAGLTLHGGMGHLRRKYGLSIDNLLSVDIVTADGQVRTASADQNEELFWAVRGAGSNFGVVTSFQFRVHPVGPTLMLCAPVYALEDAPAVLPRWREFMATAPEEISSTATFWSIPPVPDFPEALHNRPIVVLASVYSGALEEGERTMQPLRELATPLLDLSGPMPFTILQSAFDNFFPQGGRYYWKSRYADRLSDELIGELCQLAARRPSALSTVEIWHHGGAMSRVGTEETAFGRRDTPFMLSFAANWTEPDESDQNIAWAREAWSATRRHSSSGALYLNFAGFGEEQEDLVRAAYGPNYERLARLKAEYDPTNFFRLNQNIKPSA